MRHDPVMNPMFAAPTMSRRQTRKHMRRQMRYMRGGSAPARWLRGLLLFAVRLVVGLVIVSAALAVMTHRGQADQVPAAPHGPTATHAPAAKRTAVHA